MSIHFLSHLHNWISFLHSHNTFQKILLPGEVDDGQQHFGVDENEERGNWSGKLDFLLSCLG